MSNMSTSRKSPSGGSGDHGPGKMVISRQEKYVTLSLRIIIVTAGICFSLFPMIYLLSSAFNPTGNLATRQLIPKVDEFSDYFTNFRALLIDDLDIYPFWNWMANSAFVASVSTILILTITALSAYSFSRFRFQGRRTLLLGILLLQVFPNLLAMVALFLILQQFGRLSTAIPAAFPFLDFIDWSFMELFGLNSLGGLIFVYMGGAMGINTWLMKGFLDSVPKDIDESAHVDGATSWQIFWLLIFPLIRPILAVVGVLSFVGTFNEFVLARVILRDSERYTLMVGMYNFINVDFNADWGKFAAGSVVAAIPIIVVYLSLQNQIVGGLTSGAVKG